MPFFASKDLYFDGATLVAKEFLCNVFFQRLTEEFGYIRDVSQCSFQKEVVS